jgi:NADH-quinone oxidoreductase subunit C
MPTIEEIKNRIAAAFPKAKLEIIPNGSPANQPSLLIDRAHGRGIALLLRDNGEFSFDFASNVTGVDWPEKTVKEKVKVKRMVDGAEKEVDETIERKTPAYLEVVYHLYSMERRHGPLVIRMRTGNRTDDITLPSLTPVWRSCDFQEREIFDLFGVKFEGHPDLRRILMWDDFVDHPLRKDYAPIATKEATV